MALETGSWINDLNIANPVGATDVGSKGDDHLRLIKTVLKASLPGLAHAAYIETAAADVISAATTDLGAAASDNVRITGTVTITSFGTVAAGIRRKGYFSGALTLTHHATALILPGAANITTAANDRFEALSLGSGNWIVLWYVKASGLAIIAPAFASLTGLPTTIAGHGITNAYTKTEDDAAHVTTLASALAADQFSHKLLHVRDEEASGTDGGTFSSGAWRTRTLNTVKTNEISEASLASNQIILPTGTYYIDAAAPAASGSTASGHIVSARLRNITDSTTAIVGQNVYFIGGGENHVTGRFTIAAAKTFELQHRTNYSILFGIAGNWAEVEVYADVKIWKTA